MDEWSLSATHQVVGKTDIHFGTISETNFENWNFGVQDRSQMANEKTRSASCQKAFELLDKLCLVKK